MTERLRSLGAEILAGNHEERLPQADAPEFAGYNWSLLRWTREQLAGLPLAWPRTLRLDNMLFAHGTPENPNLLLYPEDLPALLAGLPEGVAWYFSGHNHHPWDVSAGGRHGVNPGSLGMLEDGHGGTAPFAIMEAEGERVSCQVCHATYDPAETRRAYVASGAAQAAPEMCRAAMYTMGDGNLSGVPEVCAPGPGAGGTAGTDPGGPGGFPAGRRGLGLGRRHELRGILAQGVRRESK